MFYKDNHSFTFSKGLTEQAKEKPTPYKPFFNYFTSIFTKITKSYFQATTPIFRPIFRKTTQNFNTSPEKSPDFPRKVLKFCTTTQKSSLLRSADKQEIFIFAKTNLNTQNNVILVAI